MKICYIAHPVGGYVPGNIRRILNIVHDINTSVSNVVPFVPYMADILAMDDSNEAERARGVANDMRILQSGMVNQMWLFGDRISAGMVAEIKAAHALSIPVLPMTEATEHAYNELTKQLKLYDTKSPG